MKTRLHQFRSKSPGLPAQAIGHSSFVIRHCSAPAYILLELIIAFSIFAIAVLGLTRSLNTTLEVANILNHDYAVRLGMRSFIEEVKRKSVTNMTMVTEDPVLDATYTCDVEPAQITLATTGEQLTDLYQLTVKAAYTVSGRPREESVVLFLYQTQAEQTRRQDR